MQQFRSLAMSRSALLARLFSTRAPGTLTVLYGSQTGTTVTLAQTVGTFARTFNFDAVVKPLDEFDFEQLPHQPPGRTVLLSSTCGTGELPRNAERFVQWLDTTKPDLSRLEYTLFGVGSSNYDTFNFAAKELDAKLQALGAKRFHDAVYGDQAAPEGLQAMFQEWLRGLWGPWISEGLAPALPSHLQMAPTTAAPAGLPAALFPTVPGRARVVGNRYATATGQGSAGLMRVEVPEPYPFLGYISVLPQANPALVGRLLRRLGLRGVDAVEVTPPEGPSYVATYAQLFGQAVDLSAMPTRAFLVALAFSATDPAERTALEHLGTDFGRGNRYTTIATGGVPWTVVDALEEFPSTTVTAPQLLSSLPPIQPRTYSICSDPATCPTELEVVYSIVAQQGEGRAFKGLASGFLEACPEGVDLRCSIKPSTSAVPAPTEAVVGVALGTGIAPFRALLQQRATLMRQGAEVGKMLLYFGFRTLQGHFLFEEELRHYVDEGLLELEYTCSHDQPALITPLDRIDLQQDRVMQWLNKGATFMFCGSGGTFPKMLRASIQQASDMQGGPPDLVQQLIAARRYQEHFFSVDVEVEAALKAQQQERDAALPLRERFAKAEMFCFQCEQTKDGVGCSTVGVCGKTPRTAALQDLLVHGLKLLGWYLHHTRQVAPALSTPPEPDRFLLMGLFTCLTNVNFDNVAIVRHIETCVQLTKEARGRYEAACATAGVTAQHPAALPMPEGADLHPFRMGHLVQVGQLVGVLANYQRGRSEDAAGVAEMLVYGLKGIAAYADHSLVAGVEDPEVYAFMAEALSFMLTPDRFDLQKALAMCLRAGAVNFKVMGNLYRSNALLGVPTPRHVPATSSPGKCVLVSGHDLHLLKDLLEATAGMGINVYTHGEMLPAHGYPELARHPHLAGHFGGPWNRQSVEFPHFPGPIVMTTNCLTEPKPQYKDRLFTFGAVGWTGVEHLGLQRATVDWGRVVRSAEAAPGFPAGAAGLPFTYPPQAGLTRPDHYTVGFGHEAILANAGALLEEIKRGTISRFFVIGGCDGYEGARNYFTEVGAALPDTGVVLTMGCGKFRVNHRDHGTIGATGLPRLLDLGQCNDSHSAVLVALALADALKCDVADLPLSFVISWLEQKAVAVFLTMLHLKLRPIYLGPSLPAFATPAVLNVLVQQFGVRPAGDAQEDVRAMVGGTPAP